MEYYREAASGFVENAIKRLKKAKESDEFALKFYGEPPSRIKGSISTLNYAIQRLSTVRRRIPRGNPTDIAKELNNVESMLAANYNGDNKHNVGEAVDHLRYAIDNLPGKFSQQRARKQTMLDRAVRIVKGN